jgi:hypothetical protein
MARQKRRRMIGVCAEDLNPAVLVVKSAKDGV